MSNPAPTAFSAESHVESVAPKRKSKLRRVLAWLKPNRFDFIVCLGALIAFLALVAPILETGTMLRLTTPKPAFPICLAMVAGCLAAISCLIVWGCLEKRSGIWALLVCLIGILFYEIGIWNNANTVMARVAGYRPAKGTETLLFDGVPWFWIAGVGVAVFGLYWVGAKLLQLGLSKIPKPKEVKVGRIQVMIGVAVVLFVAAKLQSVFFVNGFAGGLNFNGSSGMRASAASVLGLLAFFVLQILPSWWLTRRIGDGFKAIIFIAFMGVSFFLFFVYFVSDVGAKSSALTINLLSLFGFQYCFLAVLLLAQPGKGTGDSSQSTVAASRRPARPTLWSAIPISLILTLLVTLFYADASVWIESKRWSAAVDARKVFGESNGQIAAYQGWAGSWHLNVSLKENHDPDLLHLLNGIGGGYVSFEGVTNKTELTHLEGLIFAGAVSLTDCELTCSQLELLSTLSATLRLTNVKIVDPEVGAKLDVVNVLMIDALGSGEIASVLNAVESSNEDLSIYPRGSRSFSLDELNAIANVSQFATIRMDELGVKSMLDEGFRTPKSMRNVLIDQYTFRSLNGGNYDAKFRERLNEFLFSQDVSIQYESRDDSQYFWDLAFAKRSCVLPEFRKQLIGDLGEKGFKKNCDNFHWVYGRNEAGEITDLFVPNAYDLVKIVSSNGDQSLLKSVESLSLNPQWLVDGNREWAKTRAANDKMLLKGPMFLLPNLKHLDLGFDVQVSNPGFAGFLPQLESLTIRFSDGVIEYVDFLAFTQLKTLVFYGVPHRKTASAISQVASLENVKIVLEYEGMLSKEEINNLKKKIGKPNVSVVSEDKFRTQPPAKFLQHIVKRGKQIRSKYLPSSGQ